MPRTDYQRTSRRFRLSAALQPLRAQRPLSQLPVGVDTALAFIEYSYYFSVFYAIMGVALGIAIDFLGVGLLALLSVASLWVVGSRVHTISQQLLLPFGCAVSYLAIQLIAHGESLSGEYLRAFIPWMFTLVIVQSLALRPGFLRRSGLALFAIGLTVLPYLRTYVPVGAIERQGLDKSVTLANPNDLGAWFGFSAVFFVIVAIEARTMLVRAGASASALLSLYVMALTVSRAPLLAAAIASAVALRAVLKRGFVPLVVLCVLVWILHDVGIFDTATASYSNRATEESGRLGVWPLALGRFIDAPLTGVGVSNIETYVPKGFRGYTPHNAFLFVALAAGIVPVWFLAVYWRQALQGALRLTALRIIDAPYIFPLTLYVTVVAMTLNLPFLMPWATITLVVAAAGNIQLQRQRSAVRRVRYIPRVA